MMESRNTFNIASLVMPLAGVVGFAVCAQCFSGRADGITMLGVFMLPGEMFWLSVIIGTILAFVALMRRERSGKMSWLAFVLNGILALWLGMGAMMVILKQ